MHVPDGIVPLTVAVGGYAVTGAATWYCLRKINAQENPRQNIPKASLLAAAFFVASLIHLPLPPTSVHLILNGLLGVILGYYAFPAILIGLFFQTVMFQHGGLTTLGLNAAIQGIPALLAYQIFQLRYPLGKQTHPTWIAGLSFLGSSLAVMLAIISFYGLIITTIPAEFDAVTEQTATLALLIAHIPLALIEGTFTALVTVYLWRVKPALLTGLDQPTPYQQPVEATSQIGL